MNKKTAQYAPLLLLVFLAGGCKKDKADSVEQAAVRKCFADYKAALLAEDGAKAKSLVDKGTLEYYGKMKKLALEATATETRKLKVVDKIIVLLQRHMIPIEKLQKMTGEDLFVHGVDQGWIGREAMLSNDIGDVTVNGSSASGVHIVNGKETPLHWDFRLEDDQWKIDLLPLMPHGEKAVNELIKDSGFSEEDFLFTVIQNLSEKVVLETVWEPLQKKTK